MKNRRDFTAAAGAALGATVLGWPALVQAQRRFQDGKDYRSLDRRVPVEAPPGKIEVIEFFWYRCPHCNAFEPKLNAWLKNAPQDVVLRRVPVAFRDEFVPQQRLYYALEAMGKVDELHGKVFHEIHVNRQPTDREDAILAFVEKNGVDKAKFQELYNSASVAGKARRAKQLQDAFLVDGVPSMGIAGRYYVDGELAGSSDRVLQVTDYLLGEVRRSA
jgi:protein dithiol oxidoreductase (disulfide-forming)